MKESPPIKSTSVTELQRTDTKLLFIPVIFVVLRIWDVVFNIMTVYASVDLPDGVRITLKLLAVSLYVCMSKVFCVIRTVGQVRSKLLHFVAVAILDKMGS